MKLHIISDLHLSVHPFAPPRTDADVVVLAGDIARPPEAIAWAQGFKKPVVLVPGNHEFYGSSLQETVQELRRLAQGTAVHVLDNDRLVLDGIRFLGSTRCGRIFWLPAAGGAAGGNAPISTVQPRFQSHPRRTGNRGAIVHAAGLRRSFCLQCAVVAGAVGAAF